MSKLETENQAPPFEVTLAGTTFKQDDPKGLQSIMVEDHVDMIGVAEIAISGNEEFEWSSLEMGADVKVVLGGSEASIFEGYITGLRHSFSRAGDVITVLAMDPLMKLAPPQSKLDGTGTAGRVAAAIAAAIACLRASFWQIG